MPLLSHFKGHIERVSKELNYSFLPIRNAVCHPVHNVIFEPQEEDGSYIQTASLPIDLQPTATLTNDLAGAAFSFRPSVVSSPKKLMEGLRVEISRVGARACNMQWLATTATEGYILLL